MCACDLEDLNKEELLDIMWAYDSYIENFDYSDGQPMLLLEFINRGYENEKI